MQEQLHHPHSLGFIGAVALGFIGGIATALSQSKLVSWRIIFSRALMNGMLSGSASLIWLVYPGASIWVVAGGAAFLGSIGTSGIERILAYRLSRGGPL